MVEQGMSTAESSPAQDRGMAFVQKVFEAVLAALAEHGFEGLTIPDVAARAGVNKTSIYRRWPGKGELVRDALIAMVEVSAPPAPRGELRGDLVTAGLALAAFLQTPIGQLAVRLMIATQVDPALQAVAATLAPLQGRLVPTALLEQAKARGEVAADVDVELVLFSFAGTILHRVLVEHQTADTAWLQRVVTLLMRGIAAADPPGEGA
jgi:AcrR family transcriptional regulator